jgi:hypothetical protein
MSNYALALKMLPETVRTLGFAGIGGAYNAIGTPITNPTRIFLLQNLTDALLMFSFDGINDHFPLASTAFILLDISSNASISQVYCLTQGQRLYVKTIAVPTAGSVYLTTFYAAGA